MDDQGWEEKCKFEMGDFFYKISFGIQLTSGATCQDMAGISLLISLQYPVGIAWLFIERVYILFIHAISHSILFFFNIVYIQYILIKY